MSAHAVKWAIAQNDLPQTEKAVLVSLARDYSPRWGYSLKSQAAVAAEIGVRRETVNRAVKALEKKGKIAVGTAERKKGQWDRRFYRLAPLEGGIKAPVKPARRVTHDHTAPCDSHQTRHRVIQSHTSRRDNFDAAPKVGFSNVVHLRFATGGAA